MIKVVALKAFDAGKGIVKKGDLIDIPEELLNHFTKNGKAALPKIEKVKAKVEEVKEVVENFKEKKATRKRKSKSKKND